MAKMNQEHVAMCILTCSTYEEAAEKAGVSKSTMYRLRKDPDFKMVINQVKNRIFQETMNKAQGYCHDSLEVLRTIMNDTKATDSSRVSAARMVLELGMSIYESEEIITRIADLEKRLKNANS